MCLVCCLLAWLLLPLLFSFFSSFALDPLRPGCSCVPRLSSLPTPLFLFLLFLFAFVVAFHSSLLSPLPALIPATLPRFSSFLAHSRLIFTHQTNNRQESPSTHHHQNKQHHQPTKQQQAATTKAHHHAALSLCNILPHPRAPRPSFNLSHKKVHCPPRKDMPSSPQLIRPSPLAGSRTHCRQKS